MCLAVYISSDSSLPIIEIIENSAGFSIREINKNESSVNRHFSKRFIDYVGSAQGCGCGFLADGVYPDTTEFHQLRKSYELLSSYLLRELGSECLELFVCWGGDEKEAPEKFLSGRISDISNEQFAFREKYFYNLCETDK